MSPNDTIKLTVACEPNTNNFYPNDYAFKNSRKQNGPKPYFKMLKCKKNKNMYKYSYCCGCYRGHA